MGKVYGYARISSKDQNENRQLIALNNFGVEQIFIDQQSGKDFKRPQYKKLLRKLKADDVLVVKSLDRFGRNYTEILEQWHIITKDKGAAIVVIDTPILDTRRDKDIIGTLIADLVLQIMSAFAQIERDFIRQRQAEGIAAAIARGVKFGRTPIERPALFPALRDKWLSGKTSAREAARQLNVAHSTFLRWCHE